MTHFRKLTAATAILSVSTLMSTAAFAETGDMTCGDFNAMDEGSQRSAAMAHFNSITDGGPEGELEAEATAVDSEMSAESGVEPLESGKDGRDDRARGEDDMVSAMIEHCKGGDHLMVRDTPSPAQRGADVE